MAHNRGDHLGHGPRPSTNSPLELVIFLIAAAPSIVGSLFGLGFILDDYEFLNRAKSEGPSGFINEISYRPLQGVYHGLTFLVFGDWAFAHYLLLGVLQGVVGVLGWRFLKRHLSPDLALASIAVWLLLASRSSIHFWISTGPNTVAMIFLLLAARQVDVRVDRTPAMVRATGFAFLALITYEGAGPLCVTVLMWVAWDRSDLAQTFRSLVAPGIVLGSSALYMALVAPRGTRSPNSDDMVSGITSHLASYLPLVFPRGNTGTFVAIATLAVLLIVARTTDRSDIRTALIAGSLVVALGLMPFVVMSFPVGYPGVLDRGNYFASMGGSVVIGSILVALAPLLPVRPLGNYVAAVAMASLALVAGFRSWQDYTAAAEDAATAVEQVLIAHSKEPDAQVFVAELPFRYGVTGWSYQVQLVDAVQLATDESESPEWVSLTKSPESLDPESVLVTVGG